MKYFSIEVGDDFGVGLGLVGVAFFAKLFLQREIVLHDAVVHDHDGSAAVAMRVRVLFAGTAVRGPAGVADAVGAVDGVVADYLFQVAQFAFGAANLQAVVSAGNGDSRRVVAAILKAAQAINNDRNNLFLADVSNNSAHEHSLQEKRTAMYETRRSGTLLNTASRLIFDCVVELFDYRIGENFARHALHFGARRIAVEAAVERELKVLALANIGHSLVTHLGQCALNGLALRIKNAFLHRDVNVGFHVPPIIQLLPEHWPRSSCRAEITVRTDRAAGGSGRGSPESPSASCRPCESDSCF